MGSSTFEKIAYIMLAVGLVATITLAVVAALRPGSPVASVPPGPGQQREAKPEFRRPGSSGSSVFSNAEVFAGTWSERWADVNVTQNIEIRVNAGKPSVTMRGWRVWQERIEGGALIYRKRGGDSDWEFEYTIRPVAKDRLSLTVFRIHDQQTFTGELYR